MYMYNHVCTCTCVCVWVCAWIAYHIHHWYRQKDNPSDVFVCAELYCTVCDAVRRSQSMSKWSVKSHRISQMRRNHETWKTCHRHVMVKLQVLNHMTEQTQKATLFGSALSGSQIAPIFAPILLSLIYTFVSFQQTFVCLSCYKFPSETNMLKDAESISLQVRSWRNCQYEHVLNEPCNPMSSCFVKLCKTLLSTSKTVPEWIYRMIFWPLNLNKLPRHQAVLEEPLLKPHSL